MLTTDIFIIFFVCHLGAEYKCIAMKIEKFGEHKKLTKFNEIIQHHVRINNYGNNFCETISLMFTFEIIISMIAVSVFGATALLVNTQINN